MRAGVEAFTALHEASRPSAQAAVKHEEGTVEDERMTEGDEAAGVGYVHTDPRLPNFLWDGKNCLLADFENAEEAPFKVGLEGPCGTWLIMLGYLNILFGKPRIGDSDMCHGDIAQLASPISHSFRSCSAKYKLLHVTNLDTALLHMAKGLTHFFEATCGFGRGRLPAPDGFTMST